MISDKDRANFSGSKKVVTCNECDREEEIGERVKSRKCPSCESKMESKKRKNSKDEKSVNREKAAEKDKSMLKNAKRSFVEAISVCAALICFLFIITTCGS
jgi:hypothetical protein